MNRLSATAVSRNFSDVLNRVAAGEEIEITRSGMTVAVLTPPRLRYLSAGAFRELISAAPPVDAAFARDIRAVTAELDRLDERDPWQPRS